MSSRMRWTETSTIFLSRRLTWPVMNRWLLSSMLNRAAPKIPHVDATIGVTMSTVNPAITLENVHHTNWLMFLKRERKFDMSMSMDDARALISEPFWANEGDAALNLVKDKVATMIEVGIGTITDEICDEVGIKPEYTDKVTDMVYQAVKDWS